jgi:hypothetical protein
VRSWGASRYAFTICAATALLAGCGGSQAPIGALGAMPQNRIATSHGDGPRAQRASSTSQSLLYAATYDGLRIYVFSYPYSEFAYSYQLKETIAGTLCSDKSDHVFVPARNSVLEYTQGSGQTSTLSEAPNHQAYGCSVDPVTGNLAVANLNNGRHSGTVAIFAQAQGRPKYYQDSAIGSYSFCGYDDQGNLFVDGQPPNSSLGFRLAELPKGGKTFTNITVDSKINSPGQVQWDGKYITVATTTAQTIYRLKIVGSAPTIVSTARLGPNDNHTQPRIQENTIIRATSLSKKRYGNKIGFWKYPGGGKHYLVAKPPDRHAEFSA